jgi:hypothetical protein
MEYYVLEAKATPGVSMDLISLWDSCFDVLWNLCGFVWLVYGFVMEVVCGLCMDLLWMC